MHIPKIRLLLFLTTALHAQTHYPQNMVINVPVANLRFRPETTAPDLKLPTSEFSNALQITQILLGEHIIAHEEFIDENGKIWLKVQVPQQQFYKVPFGWHAFPGWIAKDDVITVTQYPAHNLVVKKLLAHLLDEDGNNILTLSIGTRLYGIKPIKCKNVWKVILPDTTIAFIKNDDVYCINEQVDESIDDVRKSIIAKALEFVGSWYSWGGRSAQNEEVFGISSVDCSGLVGLSFLAHGLQIPRMSHEQFLRCEKIEDGKDLQPGDLIFFCSITKCSTRMDHVMIYLGDNQLVEASFIDDHMVRTIPFHERMCLRTDLLHSGDIIDCTEDTFRIFFGTFFKDETMIQGLRDDALNHTYN